MLRYFFISIVLLLTLISCASDEPTSTPTISIVTKTPAETAIPTREGVPNLAGKSILVYQFCSRSGASAIFSESYISATADTANYINQNGGIFGAELLIELIVTEEDAEIAQIAFENAHRLNIVPALILICDLQNEIILAPLLADVSIVAIGPGLAGAHLYSSGAQLFSPNPVPEIHYVYWLEALSNNWEIFKPLGSSDEIRMAYLSSTNLIELPLLVELAEEAEIELVLQSEIAIDQNEDIYDFIYSARDANANVIYVQANGQISANLINALNILGLRERLAVIGPASSFESQFSTNLLFAEYASGTFFSSAYEGWGNQSSPMAQQIFVLSQRESEEKNGAYLAAIQLLDMARFALEEAIISSGFEELSAESISDALNELENIELILASEQINYIPNFQMLDQLQISRFAADGFSMNTLIEFSKVPEIQTLEPEE